MTAVTPERGDGLKPERCLNYEGAMSDLDSALGVLIRRINGEADLASAAEWVRLNYPWHAASLNPAPSHATDEVVGVIYALIGHASHDEDCPATTDGADCDCGYRDAMSGARSLLAKLEKPHDQP